MRTSNDPIIDEIHAVRRAMAERFAFDAHRITEDARKRQNASNVQIWKPMSEGPTDFARTKASDSPEGS
jgi:hypothetical protein